MTSLLNCPGFSSMEAEELRRSHHAGGRCNGFGEQLAAGARDGFVQGYVGLVRAARSLAECSGARGALDHRDGPQWRLFLRSLFAVQDIDALDRLDLAWWTFSSIVRLDAWLDSRGGDTTAFEYGAGASTLWLARRCRRVVSVEHDPRWWPLLARRLAQVHNVEPQLVPGVPVPRVAAYASGRAGWRGLDFTAYVHAIRRAGGPFDLIVIDGRARGSCLLEARDHLAPGGLILFDDSSRKRYRRAFQNSGLHVVRLRGFAPSVPWPSETAILTRDPSSLRLA